MQTNLKWQLLSVCPITSEMGRGGREELQKNISKFLRRYILIILSRMIVLWIQTHTEIYQVVN